MNERSVCIDLNEEFRLEKTVERLPKSDAMKTVINNRNKRRESSRKRQQVGEQRGRRVVARLMTNPAVTQEQEEESVGQSENNVFDDDGEDRGLYYDDDDDYVAAVPEQVSTTSPTLVSMLTAEFDCHSLSPRLEKRIKELESCQNEVMKVKEEMTELKKEVEEYKRQVAIYEMAKKSRKKTKVRDEATKTIIQEARSVFASKVGRYVKFPGPGWKLFSKESNTVCGMMLPEISFPSGSSDGEKKMIWEDVLVPLLSRMLTDHKNKITQLMRKQYIGENGIVIWSVVILFGDEMF